MNASIFPLDEQLMLDGVITLELRSRFKIKAVDHNDDPRLRYLARPDFQRTTFGEDADFTGPEWTIIDLDEDRLLVAKEHPPFWRTKQYIVTYQIRKKNESDTA